MIAAAERAAPTWLTRPEGIVSANVCPPTGLLPGPDCPATTSEWFAAGTEPRTDEQYFVRGSDGTLAANVPADARAWAMETGVALANGPATGGGQLLQVVQPARGSVLYLSPELNAQQMKLRATAPADVSWIELRVDGQLAGRTDSPDASFVWRLDPGRHDIEAVAALHDGTILRATSTYEVRAR
jgi:hypothetical protein